MAPPNKKRKTGATAPAEINFDFAAREEYLTGFHKRKVARVKHAQEEAAKKEKEERQRFRREMRRQRREDLEKHVSQVNALLRRADGDASSAGESSGEEDEYTGLDDPHLQQQEEDVNRKDEYIDEDKYTTVTIESVGIGKQGFEKADGDDSEEEDEKGYADGKKHGEDGKGDGKKRTWAKEKPKTDRPKKKKKKFRYESKAERKATRMKQGAKNRAAALARKSK